MVLFNKRVNFYIGEKALKQVNYTVLMENELNLSWYKPGGIRDKVLGNIFVKGLSSETKSKDLYEYFSKYGSIFSCIARYTSNGKCRGFGYVHFESKESAEKAIADANDKEMKGKKLQVTTFIPKENRSKALMRYNNLFVKNIPKRFKNEDLHNMFGVHGKITSAVVIKETEDAMENKGFGFVCFEKPEEAKVAEEKLKNTQIEGQELSIFNALKKNEHKRILREDRFRRFKDCNLFVKEIPEGITDEKLKKAFEDFGKVISVRVMMERKHEPSTGKIEYVSKKFGFVCFSKKEEAKEAILAASKKEILGVALYVAIAEKKEERRAKIAKAMMYFPGQYPMYGFHPPVFGHPYSYNERKPRYVF